VRAGDRRSTMGVYEFAGILLTCGRPTLPATRTGSMMNLACSRVPFPSDARRNQRCRGARRMMDTHRRW